MPLLHRAVLRMPPVVPQPTPEDAIVNLNFLAHSRARASSRRRWSRRRSRGCRSRDTLRLFGDTVVQMLPSTAGDQLHGRAGVRDALLGHGHRPGPEPDRHRLAVPVLRHAARLAGRRADRHRRGLERAVRQPAEGDGEQLGLESDPDGRGQLDRRRDGQDDRRPVDRRGEHRDASAGQRGGDLQGRVRAQHRAGVPRRASS